MPSSKTSWVPNPDLVFTKLDEQEGVLLHLKTKQYFSLNETGVRIWELLEEQQHAPAGIASALAEEYDVEQEEALRYVRRFLEEMREEHLVIRPAAGA